LVRQTLREDQADGARSSHAEATRRRIRARVTEGLCRGEHTFARRFRDQLRSAKGLGGAPHGDARTFGDVA